MAAQIKKRQPVMSHSVNVSNRKPKTRLYWTRIEYKLMTRVYSSEKLQMKTSLSANSTFGEVSKNSNCQIHTEQKV